MTKHIRITIEADDLTEPVVYEADVTKYRFGRQNQFAKLEYDGKNHYANVGGSLNIDWDVAPVWDFSK